MTVPVVQVRIVRMTVHERFVHMLVRMWLDGVRLAVVQVPVMLVMRVPMGVSERSMLVQMLVPLGEVEPDATRHEERRNPECRSGRIAKQP